MAIQRDTANTQQCAHCGREDVPTLQWWKLTEGHDNQHLAHVQWVCSDRCWSAYYADEPPALSPGMRKPYEPCVNCGAFARLARERCPPCYAYYWHHGFTKDRPITAATTRRRKPQHRTIGTCQNCGDVRPLTRQRCNACYIYWNRMDEQCERPYHVYALKRRVNPESRQCRICGRVVVQIRHQRCGACAKYFAQHGCERPPAMIQRNLNRMQDSGE